MNKELAALFQADQADRTGEIDPQLLERDRVRRQRVKELVAAGSLEDGADFFHAAMIYQHGEELEDYWQAHTLAKKAAEWGHQSGRWLAAAAYDRWLMHQGQPQKYGTQYRVGAGGWQLYQVDPATTDEERAEWNVPPLVRALERAEEMNRTRPPQPSAFDLSAPVLATLQVPGLTIEVRVQPDATNLALPAQPVLEPLAAGEKVCLPAYLPNVKELSFARRGKAYCALAPDGEVVVSWFKPPAFFQQRLICGWRKDNSSPVLEALKIGDRTAVLLTGNATDRHSLVVLPANNKEWWMVNGSLPKEELIKVATSLPSENN
jgi:hypothetical protein